MIVLKISNTETENEDIEETKPKRKDERKVIA
jgi:hypothetical protein